MTIRSRRGASIEQDGSAYKRTASRPTELASAYQQAIDATTQTILARAQRYRNLVVAVVVVLVGSILVALITWSWLPLLGAVLVVPFYGAFAISDARLVLAWQRQILTLWTDHRLDLKPLRDALSGVPGMPTRTLNGMLTMLPLPTSAESAEVRATPMRKAAAFVTQESHILQQVNALLTAAARLIALGCLFLAIVLWSVLPLLGLLMLPVLFAVSAARTALGLRRWRDEIAAARAAGFDRAQLRQQLNAVQCGGASAPFIRQLTDRAEQPA